MTRTLERIVIAIDESSASAHAVEEGLSFAADEGASVVFVHVVAIPGEQWVPHDRSPDRVPAAARAQSAILAEAGAKAAELGVAYASELLVGYPPIEIALVAEELDADLIVVGSRRLSGLERLFIGSTSRGLIGETTRPLLIIPEPVHEPAFA